MADWVTLARIARPRGVRGEVIADGDTANPEKLLEFRLIHLFPPGDKVELESAWVHSGRLVLKLRGINSMTDAERLRNCELRIPLEDRPPAGEGEYYFADLVGCRLIERATGEDEGEVIGWQDCGGPVVLEVKRPGAEEPMLVPFAKAICQEVDLAGRRILVNLPQGLKELEP